MTDREAVQFLDDWIKTHGPQCAKSLGARTPDEVVADVASRMFARLRGFPTPEDALRYARRAAANEVANDARRRARQRTAQLPDWHAVADPSTSEWDQQQELEETAAKGRHAERFLRDVIARHPGEPSRVVAVWLNEGMDVRRTALRLLEDEGVHHPSAEQVYEMERQVSRNKSRFFGQHVEPLVRAGLVPVRLLAPLAVIIYGGTGKTAAAKLVDRVMTRRHFLHGILDYAWRLGGRTLLRGRLLARASESHGRMETVLAIPENGYRERLCAIMVDGRITDHRFELTSDQDLGLIRCYNEEPWRRAYPGRDEPATFGHTRSTDALVLRETSWAWEATRSGTIMRKMAVDVVRRFVPDYEPFWSRLARLERERK